MRLRSWVRAKQRALAAATTFSAVGLLVATAVIHPGFTTTHIDLNDGGVWVTNSGKNLVGHLNFQSKTLDGGLMAASGDFDVLQHSSSVLVSDRGNASLGRVKVSSVTLEQPQQLPGTAVPAFGEKAVAVADPSSGRLWVTQSNMLGSIDYDTQEPVVTDAQGIVATVGTDDVVHAADPARGEVTSLRVNATGGVDSRDSVQYERHPRHRGHADRRSGGQARPVRPRERNTPPSRRPPGAVAGRQGRKTAAKRALRRLRRRRHQDRA